MEAKLISGEAIILTTLVFRLIASSGSVSFKDTADFIADAAEES